MFYKILEFIARIVYFRRILYVNKIGEAAKTAQTDSEAALLQLTTIEKRRLHPNVLSVLWMTRGHILDMIGKTKEAEDAVIRSAKIDPANMRAHLYLAKMSGRRFQFKNAKARFEQLTQVAEEEIKNEAQKMLDQLESIRLGETAEQFQKRAKKMGRRPLGPRQERPGLPADIQVIDNWMTESPADAQTHLDDIAILIGESEVQKGATWKISLDIQYSEIHFTDGRVMNPFQILASRLSHPETSLSVFIDRSKSYNVQKT